MERDCQRAFEQIVRRSKEERNARLQKTSRGFEKRREPLAGTGLERWKVAGRGQETVVDSSVAVKWYSEENETDKARVQAVGGELTLRASVLTVRWGNLEAYSWRSDRGFWLGIGLGSDT